MAFIFVENMSTGIKKNQDILRTSIVTFTVPISCRSYRSLSRNVWLLAFGKSQIRNEAGGKKQRKERDRRRHRLDFVYIYPIYKICRVARPKAMNERKLE